MPKQSPEQIEIDVPVENSVLDSETNDTEEDSIVSKMKREPGRLQKVKTGKPGRASKLYNMVPADPDQEDESDDEIAGLIKHLDPTSTEEVFADPNANEFFHLSNRTWEIVDFPSSRKPIGSRFVLKTKLKNARHRFVRNAFELMHMPTVAIPADILMKSLFGPKRHH